jgi:L-lactate dehydrogenase complex protein LldG
MKDAARNTVLGAIRHHLAEARRAEALPADREALPEAGPASAPIDGLDARVARFAERLGAVGGHVWRVADAGGAVAAVAQILGEHGVHRVACSDDPLCAEILRATAAGFEQVDVRDRAALFAAEAGLSSAQLAVAETGTLILRSDVERHRLVSLLPPLHVAVVPTSRLVDTMAAALGRLADDGVPPTLTFVTGPSRTADIELTLVIGVHGPRDLHVVLVDRV